MAKWDFKIVGASFVKELVPVGDDVNPRSQSFMQPSFDLEGDKIVMKESGQYKTAIGFTQIGEIDGVAPTDLEDAYAKLLTLVENFNGGGGAPGTTPSLPQVLAVDNKTNEIPIVSNNGSGYLNIGDDAVNLGYGTPNVKSIQIEADAFTLNSDVSIIINGGGLRIDSINYGLVIPRMTTSQKNAIATPLTSMLVYDTTLSKFYQYNGSAWVVFGESGGAVDSVNGQTGVVVLDAADVGADAITTATTGAVISFATPQIYNSIASPSSSNITDNLTGARIGVVQKIYHNAGTAPTVPAGWVLRGTGAYVTSTLNIIYAEWSVGTTVEYWITQ